MARRRDRNQPVIVASAARVDTEGSRSEERREILNQKWQRRAWDFYDDVPEVRSAARYYSNSFARVILVPAIRIAGADPTPLKMEGDPEHGYTSGDAKACWEALGRLKSPQGGQTEILRAFGLQLFVPGECYLCGREDEFVTDGERWDVYSSEELQVEKTSEDGRKFTLKRGQTGTAIPLPADSVVIRVWSQHPRNTDLADSPIRSALSILQELVILTEEIQGSALSRLAGPGLFILPKSVQTPRPPDAPHDWVDPKIQEMLDTWSTAIQDPSSASRYTPVFMFVEDSIYANIGPDKLIQWGREADAVMAEQREHLLRRFRTAIDLPADYDQIATTNHWSAWFIPQEAFSRYIEPGLGVVEDALTTRYFWPALTEEGMADPSRFVVWHDASGLITKPDRTTDAMAAHEAYLISDVATRREIGYSEDDKPDEAEIAQRIAIDQARRSSSQSTAQPGAEKQTPPTGAAIIASGGGIASLDRTLATMDAGLLRDLQLAADATMRRALERANARVQSLALKESGLRAALNGFTPANYEIIPALGIGTVKRLTAAEDPSAVLLDGGFDGLAGTWTARTGRSIEELLKLGAQYGTLSDVEVATLRGQLEEDNHAGWLLLLGALTVLAKNLLYDPTGGDHAGEFDGSLVPSGTIRAALARAGGGGLLAPNVPASSFLTGETILRLWLAAGITFEGWRWDYGDPGSRHTNFEPHRALDGVEFSSWDDDKLGNHAGVWPYVSHWSPGDHMGDQCLAVRVGAKAGTVPDLALAGRQA